VLREARRADLPAEHAGSRGLRRWQAVLTAVVEPTPPWVVACRRPCLCVACLPGVDDVASVAVLDLPARVKDPLPDRRLALVGGLPRRAARVNWRLRALRTPDVPRAPLLVNAECRALGLLHGRLLNECLRLTVQVPRLGRRGSGHGPQQCRGSDELLARSRGRAWVVYVEVGVDALAGLLAQLTRAFTARGGFPSDGGVK
jgi:hypothetical protein